MKTSFKLIGEGLLYEALLTIVEQVERDDLLVIAANNVTFINNAIAENSNYSNTLIYCDLLPDTLQTIKKQDVLFGFVCGDITDKPVIIYGGEKRIYQYINKLTTASLYLENSYHASMLNYSISGIHYTYLLANYVGIVLCKKYGIDIEQYLYHVKNGTVEVAQGAYRNIVMGLNSDNDYSDIDDVIHGMEMLVCQMKKTNGSSIFSDKQLQIKLNKTLSDYWQRITKRGEADG
ncbi:MAG: hypothetical protein ACI4WG_05610 [Erysipelotrichaceae bacterium]